MRFFCVKYEENTKKALSKKILPRTFQILYN